MKTCISLHFAALLGLVLLCSGCSARELLQGKQCISIASYTVRCITFCYAAVPKIWQCHGGPLLFRASGLQLDTLSVSYNK